MSDYLRLRITCLQFAKQGVERDDLFGSAGVARAVVFGQPTLVADAYARGVESFAVRSDLDLSSTWPKGAVSGDVVVITDVAPAVVLHVIMVELFDTVTLRGFGRTAMDDQKLDTSHGFRLHTRTRQRL